MRLSLIIILSFFQVLLRGQGNARVVPLDSVGAAPVDLSVFAGLYTDESGELTIEDMLRGRVDFTYDFTPDQPTVYPAAHWLRVEFAAAEGVADRWLLFRNRREEYRYFGALDYVDAYRVKAGEVEAHYRTGYLVPEKEKAIAENSLVNVLPFALAAGEKATYYIRISSGDRRRNLHLALELRVPVENVSYVSDWLKWNVYGAQGMYLIIGFYVLVFWFFVRQETYLWFGAFCLLFSLHYFNIEPASSAVDLFFPNQPWLALPAFQVAAAGSMIFLLIFGYSFAEVRGRLPGWDRYFRWVIILYSLVVFISLTLVFREPHYDFTGGFFLAFLLVLPLSVKFVRGAHRLARVFGIGIFWFLFWSIIGLLDQAGLLPFELPFIPWTMGQIGLLMIYALGLGYKILESERQKARAQRIRELDAIKSRFFANVSHEFRTPLSLILGPVSRALESIPASESMEDEEEVPVKGRHLKMMKRNALRLQNLVGQLLDLSKLDSRQMKLNLSRGAIIAFIRSIVFSFESLAEHRHVHFQAVFPGEPAEAWFDRDKLEKILVNLLSNAFKFTPDHGHIRVQVEDLDGMVKLLISDSGPGIPAAEAGRIFDRFYQVEGTEAQGTGIGLALVKELVDLHGGQISVDSVVGEGTTFKVTLPYRQEAFDPAFFRASEFVEGAATASALPAILPLETDSPVDEEPEAADRPLALIAEDNPDLRRYIRENVETDYQVITAKDGRQGIEMAIERLPDIIISDVMMPDIDGFELCAALKADTHTSHIPIILLTARAGRDHKIEGLERGADDYLTKPFDVRELKARMSNLIEGRERLRERFKGELVIRPTQITLGSVDERFIREVMQQVEANMDNEFFTVEELARAVGFSRSQLNRKIKALTGKTSNQMIRDFRLTRAKELLEQKSGSVSEVAYQVGYSNLSYFSKCYKEAFGILPSET